MNNFLRKIFTTGFVLFFVYAIAIFGVFYFNYNHTFDYPAAIKNKYDRLESLKKTPKIIICGGSSSSYSIDSGDFEQSFNMPVVNTTLAMSLGSRFHLNMVKDYLCENDIVIYIPEYEFYYGNEDGDDFLYTTAFYDYEIIKDFTQFQKQKMIQKSVLLMMDYYLGSLQKLRKTSNLSDKQYLRESYNKYGDNISLLSKEVGKVKVESPNRYQKLKDTLLSKKFIAEIESFQKLCTEKNVAFFMSFPPIEKSQYSPKFWRDINQYVKVSKIHFLGNPDDFVYDSSYFYDSSYHLMGKGRRIRSEKLKNYLLK